MITIYFIIGLFIALWVLFDCKDFYLADDKPIYSAVSWFLLAFLLWPLIIAGSVFMAIVRKDNI